MMTKKKSSLMIKALVLAGIIVLILGTIGTFVGLVTEQISEQQINECNSTEGQIRQVLSDEYRVGCEEAQLNHESSAGYQVCGIVFIIIGISLVVVFLVTPVYRK